MHTILSRKAYHMIQIWYNLAGKPELFIGFSGFFIGHSKVKPIYFDGKTVVLTQLRQIG